MVEWIIDFLFDSSVEIKQCFLELLHSHVCVSFQMKVLSLALLGHVRNGLSEGQNF